MLSSLSSWLRFRTVAYLTGRGLVFGSETEVFPHEATDLGKYALYADVGRHARVDICDNSFDLFTPEAFDYVFVGRRLESVRDPEASLREAISKLKVGGHLILFLPLVKEQELVHSFTVAGIRSLVDTTGSWTAKDSYERDGWSLQIFKKTRGPRGITDWVKPTRPRALVARYGALGDMVMVTPLLRHLAEDGYHVTVNCTRYSAPVLDNNPYVHNLIIQERDAIPNHELGDYWSEWSNDYDRYINLSESIEGTLLKVEGRRDFYTRQQWRHERCNVNYYDYTMQRGGYPESHGERGELYLSRVEEREARKFRNRYADKFLLVWALNGSSHHKVYGLFEPVLTDWLNGHPDAIAVTVGDHTASLLEFEHTQLVPKAGVWPIRTSLAMTKYADLVVGPESVITNTAGCFATPKITFLSHSSHENLCKYWLNDYCLEPDPAVAPCYPCHQLHYTRPSCPLAEIKNDATGEPLVSGPLCSMGAISGERVVARLSEVYDKWKARFATI